MRIQGLGLYTTQGNYNSKNNFKNKPVSNPQFTGTVYDIKLQGGATGIGPGCIIYQNGEYLDSANSGMYEDSNRAIYNLVNARFPGDYYIEIPKALHGYSEMGKLYIADPEETITQEMREKYNYIATERAPQIPTLGELDHKFHVYRNNPTNYNEELDKVKAYYTRMLIADTKERANYEIKKIKDDLNLKKSLEAKNHLEGRIAAQPGGSTYLTEKLNKEKYFISLNHEALRDDNEKLAYYDYKNAQTRRKIEFIDKLTELISKTGDSFIRKDIIAKERDRVIDYHNESIVEHIDIMAKIRVKELEKEVLMKQIAIAKKHNKALISQGDRLNCYKAREDARRKSGIIKTADNRIYSFHEEMDAANAQLNKINEELNELNKKRHSIQKYIHNRKIEINNYSEQIRQILEPIEPIYQELKSYYESNYPFNE